MSETETKTISFSAMIGLKEFLVGWAVLLITYFAMNIDSWNWMTLLFQSSIIVASAVILLIVYENSKGNNFSTISIDWKTIAKYVLILIGIIVGIGFIIAGLLYLSYMFPFLNTIMALFTVVIGVALIVFAYKSLKNKEDQ